MHELIAGQVLELLGSRLAPQDFVDLVVAMYGGNYADRVGFRIQQDYVPNYILPAVREAEDDANAPVTQREFVTPYGRRPKPATSQ